MSRVRKSGGGTCSVAVCPSPKCVTYHTFPKEGERLALWISACKRKDPINIKTARICSNHFTDDDYIRDLRNELLNLPTRKLLKPNAVPSINLLPGEITLNTATADRLQSQLLQQPPAAKRGRKRKAITVKTEPSISAEDSDTELYEAEYELNDQQYIKKEFVRMRSHIKYLEEKLQEQQRELTDLRKFKRNFSTSITIVNQEDHPISWS